MLAIICVLAQVLGLSSIGFMLFDLFTFPDELVAGAGDAKALTPFIEETIASYRPYFGTGVVGAIAAWLLILKGRYWADWFLKTSRIISWIWMPVVPVGTVLGILVLSARSVAIESRKAT